MNKITLPPKIWSLFTALTFSTLVFSTVSTSESAAPVVTVESVTEPVCASDATGAIDLTVEPSAGNLYSWEKDGEAFPGVTEDLTNITAGTYTLYITGPNGEATKTVIVGTTDAEPPVLTVNEVAAVTTVGSSCTAEIAVPKPEVSDNCGETTKDDITFTRSDGGALADPYPIGETTITWYVKDANGNAATPVSQVIEVIDGEAPVAVAQDYTLELNASGTAILDPEMIDNGSSDSCDAQLTYSVDKSNFTCTDLGANTVTLTVSDGTNTSTATATVTVVDNTAPVITAPTINQAADSGECFATVAMNATAADCSTVNLTGERSDGLALEDTYPVGTTTITWTATDANNLTSSKTQQIIVEDKQIPLITTTGPIEVNNEPGTCEKRISTTLLSRATATDNCGVGDPVPFRSDGKAWTDPYPVGTTTINWKAEDIHGNISSEKQIITVIDAEAPVVPDLPVIESSCAITLTPPTTTDNCTASSDILVWTNDPETYEPQNNVAEHFVEWRFEDEAGNVSYATQKVVIDPIITSISTTPVSCYGGNDGSITVEATGGKSPYTYALNEGAFSSSTTFTGLTSQTYTLRTKDATGCIREDQVTIDQPEPLVYTPPAEGNSITTTAESCFGALDGRIQVNGTISGGVGPYEFSVDNENFTSNPILGLASGSYEVFVRDAEGCRLPQSLSAVVEGPDKLTAVVTPADATCYQTASGSIKISNPAGGNENSYSFRINGGTWQSDATSLGYNFTGLTAGDYVVEMKDDSGCFREIDTVTITQPDKLVPNISTTRTTTYGTATGTATANPTGGNGTYLYEWRNSAGTVVATTKSVSGLKAGTYELSVKDSEGCTTVESFTIFDAVKAEISAISMCVDPDDLIRTSTIQVDLDQTMGGEGNNYSFKYTWDFGEGASLPDGTTGVGPFTVEYATAGEKTITLTVTDNKGTGKTSVHTFQHYVGECFETCDSSKNFAANNNSFYVGDSNGVKMEQGQCDDNEPMYIWFYADKSSNVYKLYTEMVYTVSTATSTEQYQVTNCYGHPDGSMIEPGDKVRLNQIGTGEGQIHWTCDQVLNLIHVTYKWTNNSTKACGDTERNMCASSNEVISVATPIRAYAETTNTCHGQEAGSIQTYAFGGTGKFQYTAVNTSPEPDKTYGPQASNIFNDLPAGNYTVTVTDDKAVADSLGQVRNSYVLTDVIINEPDSAIEATLDQQNISCYGAQDGWAEVTSVTGGVPGYTYLWNDSNQTTFARLQNVGPGTYTVTITDSWGCTLVKTVTLTGPPALTQAKAGPDQTRCGFNTTTLEGNTPVSGTGKWEIVYQPTGAIANITDPTNPTSEFTGTEGKYKLAWVISDSQTSCTTRDEVIINIIEKCNFLDFDGLDDYITFGSTPYNFESGVFSIEAWVKPNTTAGTRTVLSKRDLASNSGEGYELVITSGGVPAFRSGSISLSPNGSVPLNTQRWYHLAVTYDGSTLVMYVDGLQVSSVVPANPLPLSSTAPFIVGATYDSSFARATKPSTHFNGWIEELRIWKKVLTAEQLRFMMNQRLAETVGRVGTTPIKGTELPMNVPGLFWGDLDGYYQLLALEAADGNGTTKDLSLSPVPGVLKNITTFQKNTAPLPYETKRDGNWRNIEPTTTPWLYGRGIWDAPNSLGINQQPINWNIVRTSHHLISGNANITVLGLLSEGRTNADGVLQSTLSVFDPNYPLNEYNPGHGLRVTHYLKLNGAIDLKGESQLVQDEGSILEETSTGYIERDQQGTASSFNYNYWSSPVSPRGSANNAPYTIKEVLRDGTDPANPGPIDFNYQYHWADHAYSGPIRLSTYWLHIYTNFKSNTYAEWLHVGETGAIQPGEGFTMKGTSGTAAIADRQNYTFVGKPYNGTIEHQVDLGNDYLVGNPYPSAIDSRKFILDNIRDGGGNRSENVFNGSLYFWDHFSGHTHYLQRYVGGYATLNLSGSTKAIATDARINATGEHASVELNPKRYIPVGQAFYVSTQQLDPALETDVTGGKIRFKNSQRTFETEHQVDDESIFKSKAEKEEKQQQEDLRAKIYLRYDSPGGYHRQLLVTKDPNTTRSFDLGYDAPLIENISEDMYWLIHQVGFVIQGVPEFDTETELPLTVKIHEEGPFTIAIDKLMNVPDDLPIHLKDTLENTTHDLRESDFTMTLPEGTIEGRFKLVFPPLEIDVENPEESEEETIEAYYSRQESIITIENPHLIPIQKATLYNLNSQLLAEYSEVPLETRVNLPVQRRASGVYIMKLETDSGTKSIKFIIN